MGERVYLIASAAEVSGGYVQFVGSGDELSAEAASARFVPGADESVLADAGWE